MTTVEAFLADIIEHPEDDTPRLILADWLEEHDDPRGEFIRVQCEMDKHGLFGHVSKLGEREMTLVESGEDWLFASLEPILDYSAVNEECGLVVSFHVSSDVAAGGDYFRLIYRRGFVAYVICPCAAWLEHGAALVRHHPLERVELSDKKPFRWPGTDNCGSDYHRWFLEMDADGEPNAVYPPAVQRLPRCLIDAMYGPGFSPGWHHDSKQSALDALSEGCSAVGQGTNWIRSPTMSDTVLAEARQRAILEIKALHAQKEPSRELVVTPEQFGQGLTLVFGFGHKGRIQTVGKPFQKVRDLPDGNIVVLAPAWLVWKYTDPITGQCHIP